MTWLSASDIANAKLPGLPVTKKGMIGLAKREGWPSRPRKGRGGGREYPLSALPTEAQIALIQREATARQTAAKNTAREPAPIQYLQ